MQSIKECKVETKIEKKFQCYRRKSAMGTSILLVSSITKSLSVLGWNAFSLGLI